MPIFQEYHRRLASVLDEVFDTQASAIENAAGWMADTLSQGGIVHVFGSGHSHMIAEEVFHRAGSLLPLNPMLDANLTFLGHLNATVLERTEGYGKVIVSSHDIRPGEVVIVVSNSGVNPVPVEVALEAKSRGARTVAITSNLSHRDAPTRMPDGRRLADVTDLVIDTCVPRGDALVNVPSVTSPVGGASSVVGIAIVNALVVETAARMAESGFAPPVIPSMNVPGGDEHMADLVARYGSRLPLLRNA
ncbi:MAG TPA: SIS domain-containing protein [Thermomicrobiales bacterium]|nr:SIS domain-containing protein [Thermomicrobiales bacterium]